VITQVFLPAQVRPAFDAIVARIDLFCYAHLTTEYQTMCRQLAGVLPARVRRLAWATLAFERTARYAGVERQLSLVVSGGRP
jgi:hypothetical protein